ncbi:MAG: aminopeptidase P family protein [Prevotellaceae bacterium]|nr:aminopeptidase P family protein [Prevotellaceae bacterium]
MNMSISEKLKSLREVMQREHLAAFIFPSTDPHNGEYVPDRWKGREWISGFNGSAGTAVVTMTSAALWTDSRYFIAAEEQLAGTEFQLMKLKMEGTPTIPQWLGKELADSRSKEVGLDGMTNACSEVEALIADLRAEGGLTLRTNLDPLNEIWKDRPTVPLNKVEIHPLEYAGEPAQEKLQRIRKALRGQHADGMLIAALDDIAWTLNLRGSDVHCNPVFVSYLLISTAKATLFVDSRKLTAEVEVYLHGIGVDVREYGEVVSALAHYPDYNILLDADEINYTLAKAMKCPQVLRGKSPVPVMKSVKNEAEIRGFRQAMLKDGVAMVKFLHWLVPAVRKGGETEISVDRKLTSLRAEQPLFRDISFDTIAGYQEHGAIVHYEATPETDVELKPEGLLLLDSGAQYVDGTTDITRTIALGPLTEEQKRVYTLVLKGHIKLELAKFPDGAAGTQIDALARECLWREGLNYLHGTGHGVGSYLNVHEGPHQIRMEWKPTPLRAGMTVTDEPGIYLEGRFGVRIENTLLIKNYMESEFGRFLQMEPLTLCPIDTTPILRHLLSDEEQIWLDRYHEIVYEKISPFLAQEEKEWLREATKPIFE